MDEQLLIQQDNIQLQPLSSAYKRYSFDRVPSYPYEGSYSPAHETHEDGPGIRDITTDVIVDTSPKNAPTARIKRQSQFSSSKVPLAEKRGLQHLISTWWMEMSACFVSVAALLALTAIL